MLWRGIEDYSLVAQLKRLSAEHYDAGYWHGRTGPSGQDSDSGMYFGIGQALADFILNRNARVLDCGCGPGWLIRHLVSLGFKQVYGVDWSVCAKRLSPVAERIQVATLDRLPYEDEEFDVVLSWQVLEHQDECTIDTILKELARVGNSKTLWVHSLPFEGTAGAVDDASHTLLRSKSWWLKRVLAVSGLVQSLEEEQHLASLFGNAKCELTGGMVLRRN